MAWYARGWHGNGTYIKLLPADLASSVSYANAQMDSTGRYHANTSYAAVWFWTIAIPEGCKATHARVNSNVTKTVTVYENELDDGTTTTSKGSGNTNTEIDITDVTATDTNYLTIKVGLDAANQQIWGGYVKIAHV